MKEEGGVISEPPAPETAQMAPPIGLRRDLDPIGMGELISHEHLVALACDELLIPASVAVTAAISRHRLKALLTPLLAESCLQLSGTC